MFSGVLFDFSIFMDASYIVLFYGLHLLVYYFTSSLFIVIWTVGLMRINEKMNNVSSASSNSSATVDINVKNCSLSTTYNGEMTHRKQQK